jgi:hypothetical protein
MAGFGLALLGGAIGGFGEGQLEAIKATREEKLRMLELDRAERIETNRQKFQSGESALDRTARASESAAQIAATERNTAAQLGMQEKLTKFQEAAQTGRVEKQITSAEKLNTADITSREKLNKEQITASKSIADAEIASRERLGGTPVRTKEGQSGIDIGGVFKPTVDADGKPVNYMTPGDNSPDAKTVQYLLDLGTPLEEAKRLVFENKNADPAVLGTSIFNNIMDVSRKNMGNPNADDITNQVTAAIGHTRSVLRNMGLDPEAWNPTAPTAPAAGGTETTPAVPGSATAPAAPGTEAPAARPTTIPEGATEAQIINEAKAAIRRGAPKDVIRQDLIRAKIDPAKAGL